MTRKKKNYDIVVNKNESYQENYHDEFDYQNVIVNETKFA